METLVGTGSTSLQTKYRPCKMHKDKGGQGRDGGFVRENLPALPSYGNQKWFHCKEKTETRKKQ